MTVTQGSPESQGSSGRRRRPASDEGPTFYKCEQLLRMLQEALRNRSKVNATTDLIKFLGQYLPVRTETNGKRRPKKEDDENPNSARFHSFCKQFAQSLDVERDFMKDRLIHGLMHDESQLKELCDHLMAATEHYDLAMSLIKEEPLNRPVTIRIGTTNLINMRVLPLVLEAVRQQFRTAYPNVQLRFVQTIMDSDELLFGSQPSGVDVIVACCLDGLAGKIPPAELVASLPLRCCLLRQRDPGNSEPEGRQCLPNWEALSGTDMVALTTRRKHFDVPWSEVEGAVETIEEVPTLLEAHARVAASDAWTLSYRELMDDVDEQRLEVLELPPDLQRQVPLIVAMMPQTKRRRSTSAATKPEGDTGIEKRSALAMLKDCLQIAFQQKQEIHRATVELTECLARFPFSYHVSDYAPKRKSDHRRIWFAGRASLECTSNGNLTGVITMGNPAGAPLHVRVFGRPISFHNGTVWHLQWRGVDTREESGTTNLVVSKTDLKEGSVLVGSWVGRSSWTDGDVRPSGGPFILHSRPDLTPAELRQLVLSHQDQCIPDLRRLSDELIPITPAEQPRRRRKPR